MADIQFVEGSIELLDNAQPLWEKLNEHHRMHSVNFKDKYDTFTFEKRKQGLLEKAKTSLLRVDLAKDTAKDMYVGYCISTIDRGHCGEVESIFVEPSYRGFGIGDTFMKKALEWMDSKGANSKRIGVSVGNEQAFSFYEKYGFYPSAVTLVQKK